MSISSPRLRFPARSGAGHKNRASRDSKNRTFWLLPAKLLAGGLWVMLLAACPARAGIGFVSGSFTCTNNGAVVTSLQLTLAASTTTGNAVAVVVANKTADTVSSISDSGGSSYAKRASLQVKSGPATVNGEIWTTSASGATASTTVTVNITGGGARVNFCVAEYSGATGIGVTATNSGTTGGPTLSLATEDNNDFFVAGIASAGGTYSSNVGNLRGQSNSNQVAVAAVCDNTASTPSSISCTPTASGNGIWIEVGFDLRLTSCTPHINWMTGVGTPLGC